MPDSLQRGHELAEVWPWCYPKQRLLRWNFDQTGLQDIAMISGRKSNATSKIFILAHGFDDSGFSFEPHIDFIYGLFRLHILFIWTSYLIHLSFIYGVWFIMKISFPYVVL